MFSRKPALRTPARRSKAPFYLPLRRLALCLDCEQCFELGADTCPACGSETWTLLARFVVEGEGDAGLQRPRSKAGHMIVVARDRTQLYHHLRRAFAGNDTVDVVLDRRTVERRRTRLARSTERRRAERRARQELDSLLRAFGWGVISRRRARGAGF